MEAQEWNHAQEDGFESDERDAQGANGNYDDPEHRADSAIRHSSERQTSGNATNSGPSDLFNRVQSSNDLGRPPAERVPANTDLSQSRSWSHCSAEAADSTSNQGGKYHTQNALLEIQAELESKEARSKAGDVHGATGP